MNRIVFLSAAAFLAATNGGAQQQPPIRPLGSVVATSTETFGPTVYVRHVKNGLLVNDVAGRRVLMLDPALSTFAVVADSTPATASAYSGRTGNLIPYRGDSSLFIDAQSTSMLVIDETGKVGRVMAIPRAQDAGVFGNAMFGATYHPSGRILYSPIPRPDPVAMRQAMAAQMGVAGGGASGQAPPAMPTAPDSGAVLAVNLQSRQVDTVGWRKTPKMKMDVQRNENGGVMMRTIANPLPTVDDWAIMSDGSIAFVRGRDYHVDWLRPDGTRESSPKIPFDWRRLSDEDKVALIDSVRAQRERMQAQALANGGPGGGPMVVGGGGGGATQITIMPGGAGGPPPGGDRAGGRSPGAAPGPGPQFAGPAIMMVEPSELPDYQPVFFAGSTRGDADGRLWVRTIPTKNLPGGPVYDVINAKGELIDRVQVPQGRTIIGFGPGGVVYLAALDGTRTKIEKANYK
jgi:hypothetical protein